MTKQLQLEVFGRSLDDVYENAAMSGHEKAWRCGVCNKEYATLKGLHKHIDKRTCYRAQDILKDTAFEKKMRGLIIQSTLVRKDLSSIHRIRNKNWYKKLAETTLFIHEHFRNESLHLRYAEWTRNTTTFFVKSHDKQINIILDTLKTEDNVRKYREWLIANHFSSRLERAPAVSFLEQYYDLLMDDDWFLIRSLERCDILLDCAEQVFQLSQRIENMNEAKQIRIEAIINTYNMLNAL